MFAKNKKEAIEVYFKLSDDGLIGRQKIYIREFVPLFTYMIGIGGLPVTKEFRFFICDDEILCGAFYWSSHVDDLEIVPSIDEVPKEFLNEATKRISKSTYSPRAYALDVGIKTDGTPIVVEINDLQQSGLSENDPAVFYTRLFKVISDNGSQNVHPGEIVTEYLSHYKWSQSDLVQQTGLTSEIISGVCSGTEPITLLIAVAFEKVFQRPTHFWLNLQRQYDEAQALPRLDQKR